MLANKCQELLGYYIIEFEESDLSSDDVGFEDEMFKPKILLNWKSKLDIGNANLHLIFNEQEGIE